MNFANIPTNDVHVSHPFKAHLSAWVSPFLPSPQRSSHPLPFPPKTLPPPPLPLKATAVYLCIYLTVMMRVYYLPVSQDDIVKLQTVNLAAKLCIANPKQTKLLCQYVLNLAKYDQNYDIRDRARFLRQLVLPEEVCLCPRTLFAHLHVPVQLPAAICPTVCLHVCLSVCCSALCQSLSVCL